MACSRSSLVHCTSSVLSGYADASVRRAQWMDLYIAFSRSCHSCCRFFRASCVMKEGNFVKELSTVETDMARVVIVDNSPIAYALNRGEPY